MIDVAVGIIVGLRGCSENDAFNEIAQEVHRTGVPWAGSPLLSWQLPRRAIESRRAPLAINAFG